MQLKPYVVYATTESGACRRVGASNSEVEARQLINKDLATTKERYGTYFPSSPAEEIVYKVLELRPKEAFEVAIIPQKA